MPSRISDVIEPKIVVVALALAAAAGNKFAFGAFTAGANFPKLNGELIYSLLVSFTIGIGVR